MSAAILNREYKHPADQWYQIEAKGYHPAIASDGTKVVQVIDDKAVQFIVNRFNADAENGALPHGREMLIDHEHFRHDKTKETRAYGWAKNLRVSPDGSGFETHNPWTNTGKAAVDGGDYRFTSTEYDGEIGDTFEEVSPAEIPIAIQNKFKGYQFLRPLKLTGLSLTNDNNNKGQRAITLANKNSFAGPDGQAGSKQNNQRKTMKSVCTLLGLSAEADETSILAAVTGLKNRCAELEPLAKENITLKNRITEQDVAEVESLMDAHGIKADAPARVSLKPVLVSLLNREARLSFLKDCVKVEAAPATHQMQLHNRNTKPPGSTSAPAPVGDKELAAAQQKEVEAYRIANRCSYTEARNQTRRMKPELFPVNQ